jgi:hypothetical protein
LNLFRYLSKLCDQLFCLLSREHSGAIAWGDDDEGEDTEGEDDDSDSASTDSEKLETSRFYHFEVAKTKDQEENVVVREGFTVRRQYNTAHSTVVTSFPVRHKMNSPLLVDQLPPPGKDIDPRTFCPSLLHGEKVQGFMTTTFVPAKKIAKPFTLDDQTAEQIRLRW